MKKKGLMRAGKPADVGIATSTRKDDADARTEIPAPDVPSPDVSLGLLGNYIGFRMRRVHDIQTREFLKLTRDENLSQGMFTALALISANPGSSQVRLAQEMGLHTSAMVSLIDELEHRGWVIRQKNQSDRRRYELVLSPGGEDALRRLIAVLDDVEADSLVSLTATELKVLTTALDKLYRAYRDKDLDPLEQQPGKPAPAPADAAAESSSVRRPRRTRRAR